MISGLHSCKASNTPYVGDVKTFVLEERTGKSGKPWTKIRSASASDGGRPYEIMSVAKTDYTDAHQNISFNLEIEPVTISDKRTEPARPLQDGAIRALPANGYEDRGNRIERQHSQHMAILYATAKGVGAELDTKGLRELIDWFQRDVSRSPAKKQAKPAPEPQEDEASPQIDESEEF